MNVSVVSFDAADTLFTERTSRPRMYADVLADFGAQVDQAELGRWMGAIHDELPEVLDGQVRYSDGWFRIYVARLLERAGCAVDAEPVRAALADRFTRPESYLVYADTFPALDDLVDRGLRLALISNWSERLPGLLERLGLLRYFEVLAVSAGVGVGKPHAGIFRWTLERLQVAPSEALHVGNHPVHDRDGARRAGLAALLLDRAGRAPPGPDVIGALTDVPGRLRGRPGPGGNSRNAPS